MKSKHLHIETNSSRAQSFARLFLAVVSIVLLTIMISQSDMLTSNNSDQRVTVAAFNPASIRKHADLHPLIPFFAINEY